jgi:hypothetical protein
MDTTYHDLREKLNDQFVEPMKSYLGQFPDIKKRVDKRDRRQLDHDRCKRAVLTARQKGSKKVNELEDQFVNAQVQTSRRLLSARNFVSNIARDQTTGFFSFELTKTHTVMSK